MTALGAHGRIEKVRRKPEEQRAWKWFSILVKGASPELTIDTQIWIGPIAYRIESRQFWGRGRVSPLRGDAGLFRRGSPGVDHVTPLAIGQLLGSVIATFMSLEPSRVVIKDESFDAPKDQGIYILIEYEGPKIIGVSSHFDPATLTETLSQSSHEHFTIEVVSRGSGAMTAFPQVLLALASTAATQAAESAGIFILAWRGSPRRFRSGGIRTPAPLPDARRPFQSAVHDRSRPGHRELPGN